MKPVTSHTLSSKRRAGLFGALLLLSALLITGISCDSRAGEANLEEERENFLILTYAINTSLTDFTTACTTAVTAGLNCATNAGGSALYTSGYLQSNFGISASSGTATTCATYPNTGRLAAYSAAARVCWFNCEAAYWNAGAAGGSCTAANFSSYAANAFASISACDATCRNTGTFFIY